VKYVVLWMPTAISSLADVWMSATDREAVTKSSQRLDILFAHHPLDIGESRDVDRRLVIDPPLQVLYRVLDSTMRVEVLSVARF
jgi:hypothetical protein